MITHDQLTPIGNGTQKQISYATSLRSQHIEMLNKEIAAQIRAANSHGKRGDTRGYELLMNGSVVLEECLLRAVNERTEADFWIEHSTQASTRLIDEAKVVYHAIYAEEILKTKNYVKKDQDKKVISAFRSGISMKEILGIEIEYLNTLNEQAQLYPLALEYFLRYRDEYIPTPAS